MRIADEDNKKEQLLNLVRLAIQRDQELRKEYQIGEKFRFISDRLQALLSRLEHGFLSLNEEIATADVVLQDDETLVYVYLYNAQGSKLQTWASMLTPKVFYEYSVNRPIYAEKSYVEAFIKSKHKVSQYAYLTIAIKRENILVLSSEDVEKDAIGHPLIKVQEGSLHFDRLIVFTHGGSDYVLTKSGELIKKET